MKRITAHRICNSLCRRNSRCGPSAQESPNFVTYDHHLEEQGDLEVAVSSTVGIPRQGQPAFIAPYAEVEYGVTDWWTSALYLEGLSRRRDSTIFTGWRLENRFRPLTGEHRINPVLYVEFANINEASRMQKEVVGHAPTFDLIRNSGARTSANWKPSSSSEAPSAIGRSQKISPRKRISLPMRAWNLVMQSESPALSLRLPRP
jgi:hypothetical protein